MGALSDALGIDHHDCGKGSNVEGSFLVAIADAIGLGDQATNRSIEGNIDLLIEYLTAEQGSAYHSSGGTITNRVLAAILNGIVDGGHAVVDLNRGAPAARIAIARPAKDNPTALEAAIDTLELSDERKRSLRRVVVREGQDRFRSAVLSAYGGRCAITGTSVSQALEAAHIRPYRGAHTNHVSNGLLLRADLHRMWDAGLLAVHEETLTVLLATHVDVQTYDGLREQRISIPEKSCQHPLREALRLQREWANL